MGEKARVQGRQQVAVALDAQGGSHAVESSGSLSEVREDMASRDPGPAPVLDQGFLDFVALASGVPDTSNLSAELGFAEQQPAWASALDEGQDLRSQLNDAHALVAEAQGQGGVRVAITEASGKQKVTGGGTDAMTGINGGLELLGGGVSVAQGARDLRDADALSHGDPFERELARGKRRGGVDGLVNGAHKVANGIGVLADVSPVSGAVDVLHGAYGVARGVQDAVVHGQRARGAERVREQAVGEGSALSGASEIVASTQRRARNDAVMNTVNSALEAVDGGAQIAKFADPTGGALATAAVTKSVRTVADFSTRGYRAVRDGRDASALNDNRQGALVGDRDAKRALMSTDPRFASTQIFHAMQQGEGSDKALASTLMRDGLGLSDDAVAFAQDPDAKLSRFGQVFEQQTGASLDPKTLGERASGSLLGRGAKKLKSAVAKLPPVKRHQAKKEARRDARRAEHEARSQAIQVSGPTDGKAVPHPHRDAYARLDATLDAELTARLDGRGQDDLDALWASSYVPENQRPDRAFADLRAFDEVTAFEADRTQRELGPDFAEKAPQDVQRRAALAANERTRRDEIDALSPGDAELEARLAALRMTPEDEALQARLDALTGDADLQARLDALKSA